MEAARPRRRPRRSRSSAVSPLNTRLVRVGFVVVAPALLALLVAVSAPGTLPPAPLAPLFDTGAAAAVASTLSVEYPSRVPGTLDADGAARWYHETVAALGLTTEDDTWVEDLADLGPTTLRNVVTVVQGRSEETIIVVAHRDNAGADSPPGDNSSGTAALIELARGYARQEGGLDPQPQHTLVFVSTDAGAYGGAGAARFADTSPFAKVAIAAVVLDGLSSRGSPAIAIAGDAAVSPARALVSTAAARVRERTGQSAALPSLATQLLDLGIPFASDEQGRFLSRGIATVTLTTTDRHGEALSDRESLASAAPRRLGGLGRAAEALVDSLDSSVGGRFRTPDTLFFADRVVSGWAVRLTLILLVVPFTLGLADLLARTRRRRVAFAPALRALRARLGIWLLGGVLVAIGALTGVFPTGAPLPLPASSRYVADPEVAGFALLGLVFVLGWLHVRRRLAPKRRASTDERLIGLVGGLSLLGCIAIVLAITRPYALIFVIPSLYAWLWIAPSRPVPASIALFLVGLLGPVSGLLLLGHEAGLTLPETLLYSTGLVTVGYVPLSSVLLAIAWAAAAAQIAAVAFGRYAPYADGAEPPPPGVLRRAARDLARRSRQSSVR